MNEFEQNEADSKVRSIRVFPIMVGKYGRETVYVPWSLLEPHERQALRNHSQTLDRLAERGGLSPLEVLFVLEDRDLNFEELKTPDDEVWRRIWSHINAD